MRPSGSQPTTQAPWLFMRNRNERLVTDRAKRGVACDWQWTSDLHLAKVFPRFGLGLMKRALRDWPIELADVALPRDGGAPFLSFVIGHRGKKRLRHLTATLKSIAAQRQVNFECIVVEQSVSPEIKEQLPSWVRYVHTPLPYESMPYSRSWSFNVGARHALGSTLIFHDNDMLVSADYAKEIQALVQLGYEVMNLKRFIFYLSKSHSTGIVFGKSSLTQQPPDVVVQNLEAGGSFAITREAYLEIGGFDEAFVGWGGEDNEFWERANSRKLWPYGYLPLVHLWHEAQPGKFDQQRQTAELFERRSAIPVAERIEELRQRNFPTAILNPKVEPLAADPSHHQSRQTIPAS